MVQIIYYVCVLLLLAETSFGHICDICDCQPNRNRIFTITCDCNSVKDLHITSSIMMGVGSTSIVSINNCQIVSIERNSFSQLQKLDTLAIQNCLQLYLAAGAFSNLNSLLINNVHDIHFGEMAFMGARDIKNIVINYSNISAVPMYSLYDIQGMQEFTLNDVNIGKISKQSINISSKIIDIQNTIIDYVQEDGFVVDAEKVLISNSDIDFQEPNSMKISTTFQTRLLRNTFRRTFRVQIESPFLELSGNRFDHFNSSDLNKIQMTKLMNNVFIDTDYERMFRRFDHKDFHDNMFTCKCDMFLLNITSDRMNYEILKKNFCNTNCSLNLFEFEVESIAQCLKDHYVDTSSFCNYDRLLRNRHQYATNLNTIVPTEEANNNSTVKIQPRFLINHDTHGSGCGNLHSQFVMLTIISIFFVLIVKI